MTGLETKLIIYSAVLSTIVFLWNIFNEIRKEKRNLRVEYFISNYVELKNKIFGLISNIKINRSNLDFIEIKIANPSSKIIYIYEQPTLHIRSNISFFKGSLIGREEQVKFLKLDLNFPIKLEPGEKLIIPIKGFDSNNFYESFRIEFKDSLGKTYRSGCFKRVKNAH